MTEEQAHRDSLTDRKRRRARAAIRQAALQLFSERGFDAVSVTDIAERAEVGRTTFFRYFGDKQEVLFSDPDEAAAEVEPRTPTAAPIGSSMPAALAAARQLVVGYIAAITADPEAYEQHQKLVSSHPELYARSLVKQRRYADELTSRLENLGATPATARQAAEMGMACFYAGQAMAAGDPKVLPRHVERAFDRASTGAAGPGRSDSGRSDSGRQ